MQDYINRILDLQPKWTSKNNPEMEERGRREESEEQSRGPKGDRTPRQADRAERDRRRKTGTGTSRSNHPWLKGVEERKR